MNGSSRTQVKEAQAMPPPHKKQQRPEVVQTERRQGQSRSRSSGRSTSRTLTRTGADVITSCPVVETCSSSVSSRATRPSNIRLTLLCAKNLSRGKFFMFNFDSLSFSSSLPDVYCRIESGGQVWTTDTCPSTTSPVWRWTHDLHLSKRDSIVITLWNRKKESDNKDKSKKAFLGCVKMKPSDIVRLRDTGFQKLFLQKDNSNDSSDSNVKGEVVVSILSRGQSSEHTASNTSCSTSLNTGQQQSNSTTPVKNTSRSKNHDQHVTVGQVHSFPVSNGGHSQSTPSIRDASSTSCIVNENNNSSTPNISSSNTPVPPLPPRPSVASGGTTTGTPSKRVVVNKPPMPLPEGEEEQEKPELKAKAKCQPPPPVIQNRKAMVAKMTMLKQELATLQPSHGHCRLEVSRDDIFEESYRSLMKMKTKELRKKLMVKFRGEEGIDYGGVAREWLYLLSKEMLNPDYGLFAYTRDDQYTLHINPRSSINPDHLSYFHFVGRVIGLALFHGHYIGGCFALPFYRLLLNKPIALDDIKDVDPLLYRSLKWILDNPVDGVLEGTTFSVDDDHFGQMQVLDLKSGGRDIAVTEENKNEYVKLFVNYRFKRGIESQFHSLLKGFHEVVPPELLIHFDERELEVVIAGFGTIDLLDWKTNTRLKHCSPDSKIVKWFWQVLESYTEEQRARLLQFVTGSPRVPLQGFKALQGTTGATDPRLFTINVVEQTNTDNLPQAHTCFNRIDLPPYETLEKLKEKLTQAVEETDAFGLD